MSDTATLRDLRSTRRRRRLGDVEWFDVAYRVYLFGLVGLTAVVIASDAIDGLVDDDVTTADLLGSGPGVLGLLVAVAAAVGLRSGTEGGPVSVEDADVRHLLLSPIDRRRILLRPLVQRFRATAFTLGLGAAIIGQLVAREVEGSRAAWAGAGVLFGAVVAATYTGCAVVAHALGLRRWAATALGAGLVGWQAATTWLTWRDDGATGRTGAGPFDLHGSLALWGIRQRAIDVVAIAVTALLVVAALAIGGRLRLEHLERRGALVSQLRFAATVQDLRTIVLLRRQLRAESVRARPWFGGTKRPPVAERPDRQPDHRPRRGGVDPAPSVVWRRGTASLRRLPAARLARIAALSVAAGVVASVAVTASPLFLVAVAGLCFLVALEAIEPLAQEIDRPDLTDGLPVDRGWLFAHHLVAPSGLLVVAGIVGATAATVLEPSHAAAAFAVAVPVALGGAIGPVVSTVRDAAAPDDVAATTITGMPREADNPLAPPEFAGFATVTAGLVPFVLSGIGVVPVAVLRFAPGAGPVVRSAIGVAICLAALLWWIRHRDRWARAARRFFADGRALADRQAAGGTA